LGLCTLVAAEEEDEILFCQTDNTYQTHVTSDHGRLPEKAVCNQSWPPIAINTAKKYKCMMQWAMCQKENEACA